MTGLVKRWFSSSFLSYSSFPKPPFCNQKWKFRFDVLLFRIRWSYNSFKLFINCNFFSVRLPSRWFCTLRAFPEICSILTTGLFWLIRHFWRESTTRNQFISNRLCDLEISPSQKTSNGPNIKCVVLCGRVFCKVKNYDGLLNADEHGNGEIRNPVLEIRVTPRLRSCCVRIRCESCSLKRTLRSANYLWHFQVRRDRRPAHYESFTGRKAFSHF